MKTLLTVLSLLVAVPCARSADFQILIGTSAIGPPKALYKTLQTGENVLYVFDTPRPVEISAIQRTSGESAATEVPNAGTWYKAQFCVVSKASRLGGTKVGRPAGYLFLTAPAEAHAFLGIPQYAGTVKVKLDAKSHPATYHLYEGNLYKIRNK